MTNVFRSKLKIPSLILTRLIETMLVRLRTLVLMIVFAASFSFYHHSIGDDQVTAVDLTESARCLDLLRNSVIDFYLPDCIDVDHGGYLENQNQDGKFVGGGKFLVLQSRQLWFFSVLAERGIDRDLSLAGAKHGFDFIRNAFHDAEYGGYYNQLNDDGSVRDSGKHAYLNAFAIYAFVAYYRASHDEKALEAALELFQKLEEKAYDRKYGGYEEMFTRDWKPIRDSSQSGIVGAVNTKTYNTHLHLMEAFADLYRATQDKLVLARLQELIMINVETVQHTRFACNVDGWRLNWEMIETEQNMRASYGHDVECAWLVLDAAEAIGLQSHLLKNWAMRIVDYSLQHGYDNVHGGFFYSGPLGEDASDRHKEWWVQAEALVCMLRLYQLTGDEKYYQRYQQTLNFVERHQIAQDGGWWAARNEDGSEHSNRSKTSMWQGAYHNGRALLRCADILKEFQK